MTQAMDKLIERILDMKNPTVVGLDPRLNTIPPYLKEEGFERFGKTPEAAAWIFLSFNKAIIDAIADFVPAVKPQIAMYEAFGAEGIRCYAQTIAYAKSKQMLVIGDVKRSDIASTAKAYSDAHIGKVDIGGQKQAMFDADFITLNPYLGADSIEPFLKNVTTYGKGIFVLVKTSNPGGGLFQDLTVEGGMPLYEHVAAYVAETGKDFLGQYGYNSFGAVVGATYPQQLKRLRTLMPETFFLIPGYGAQGGKAEDLPAAFDERGLGALVNASRAVIEAYCQEKYQHYGERNFAEAAAAAAKDMRDDLRRNIECWKNM